MLAKAWTLVGIPLVVIAAAALAKVERTSTDWYGMHATFVSAPVASNGC